ncbi:hypothetical protein [Legionella micdadei]|uniref:hypothetical protein n=1 Tax=Legionella micdadei TaxID=451 RepID=UPI0009EF7778|nr:hypothetical protein [Legionella micdadei]ARH01206.1 hypothetical protein B6V88_12790 [Legionella micdadei]
MYSITKKAILKSKAELRTKESKVIITISVGQPSHEGDKFLSTLFAVNKQFAFARIMVCDSLQRHTMKITSPLSLEELHIESIRQGDEWITRNIDSINRLTIPYHISKWDEWLSHPGFIAKYQFILELYAKDPFFKTSIQNTVEGFITRNPERVLLDRKVAYPLSRDYLLEECAVMLLLADEGFEYEIYPNERNEALDFIYQNVIAKENKQLMQAISVKFKRISYT